MDQTATGENPENKQRDVMCDDVIHHSTKWVLSMLMERDRSARMISILQGALIDLILTCFNLTDAPPITAPPGLGTHPSADDFCSSKDDMDDMAVEPYRELVGALACLALGHRPDIASAHSSRATTQSVATGEQRSGYCVISKASHSRKKDTANRGLHRR
jgi:hypothetical protein